jgi:phosphinothricin acetyltransferase
VFVAEEDDVLLGFSSIGPFRKWEAYKFSVENSVYVSNEHRGKGVGKLLLQPLIDAARSLQLHTIVAGIDATNEASIALHKKFGFEEVAHFKEVGYKFGRWLDLKFLQLIL